MYDCLSLGCAERGLCGTNKCNRWVKYLKDKKMEESKIQRKIISYINTIGYCVKIQSASKSGVPDLLCCVNGRFIALEIKRCCGGITSPLQEYNIQLIQNAGGIAHVVSSLEEVKNILGDKR